MSEQERRLLRALWCCAGALSLELWAGIVLVYGWPLWMVGVGGVVIVLVFVSPVMAYRKGAVERGVGQ